MKKHWKYLKYVLRHKWYVAKFLMEQDWPLLLAPQLFWACIVHDFSKFRPSEWVPYVDNFYGEFPNYNDVRVARAHGVTIKTNESVKAAFDVAWLHHQKRNPHHWQYWLLTFDKGNTVCLPMPERYILEMVADWTSAGYCITGKIEVDQWYKKNYNRIRLHPETRKRVDWLVLGIIDEDVRSIAGIEKPEHCSECGTQIEE